MSSTSFTAASVEGSNVLSHNAIYIVLFHLPSLEPPKYHWALGVILPPNDPISYHAKDKTVRGQPIWQFERESDHAWSAAGNRHLAMKVADYDGDQSRLLSVLSTVPLAVEAGDAASESSFTCRIWVRNAVRILAALGIIRFKDGCDALTLEAECNEAGARYHKDLQPTLYAWDTTWDLRVTTSALTEPSC